MERFGSWKKALALIGISGGRKRCYSPDELITNLESIWQQFGHPPGRRQIATLGERISESPYKRHWGSLHAACEAVAAFHDGRIGRPLLLAGNAEKGARVTIPLRDRWAVLKRDNYRCTKCGASPSSDHQVALEVDHINPVTKGGETRLRTFGLSANDATRERKPNSTKNRVCRRSRQPPSPTATCRSNSG